jgi:hypothetical protein
MKEAAVHLWEIKKQTLFLLKILKEEATWSLEDNTHA